MVAASPVTGAYPDPVTPFVVENMSLLATETTCIIPPELPEGSPSLGTIRLGS
mgnify:CR=1 FL=1